MKLVSFFLILCLNTNRLNFFLFYLLDIQDPSLTFDGPASHFSMAHSLGANLSITNTKTFFPHPCDPTKFVNCIIDPCHALKLVRNAWSSMRVIYDADNNKIDWVYIEKLVTLQENEGLHAGNKLKRRHLE